METDKLSLESMNISDEKLNRLKSAFPEVFTEGEKIDFDKLKTVLGEQIDTDGR